MDKKFGENALILIWTVAVAATGGSLFYSGSDGIYPVSAMLDSANTHVSFSNHIRCGVMEEKYRYRPSGG